MKSYIFRTDFQHRYNAVFQQYVIDTMFGGNIVIGSDLIKNNITTDEEGTEE